MSGCERCARREREHHLAVAVSFLAGGIGALVLHDWGMAAIFGGIGALGLFVWWRDRRSDHAAALDDAEAGR